MGGKKVVCISWQPVCVIRPAFNRVLELRTLSDPVIRNPCLSLLGLQNCGAGDGITNR